MFGKYRRAKQKQSQSKPSPLWLVIGKSVTGATHIRHGKPCQDAILWQEVNNAMVLAVADGHGSERSPYSDKGARFAVEVAVQVLSELYNNFAPERLSILKHYAEEQLANLLVRRWIEQVKSDINPAGKIQAEEEPSLVEYGSTLLATLLAPNFLLFLQLGDGDILVVGDERVVERPIFKDERLIANETTSLSMPHAWREMQIAFWPVRADSPRLVMLSTDGYANSFVSEQDFLKAAVDYLDLIQQHGAEWVDAHLEEWLNDASMRGSGDDITVGLAFRKHQVTL